ncbi:MAG: hypothetical protein EA350_10770 [Gemmatimonadales bacterium]|nr:MAG: hypothetical protein EA350_10770 [Gemmatimonadales bacterium]
MLHTMISFLAQLLDAIQLSLSMRPDVLQVVEAGGATRRVTAAVAILGGASLLAGESVVLFLNQVPRGRFLLSLLLNGVIFALTLGFWALVIWWIGVEGFGADVTLESTIHLVGLGAAPFLFGFLVLAPYFGPAIARILWVWSLLIMVQVVAFSFEVHFLAATACVGVGWVLVLLAARTVGRPVVRLRNVLWNRVVGPTTHASASDILAVALDATEDAPGRGSWRSRP